MNIKHLFLITTWCAFFFAILFTTIRDEMSHKFWVWLTPQEQVQDILKIIYLSLVLTIIVPLQLYQCYDLLKSLRDDSRQSHS